MNTNLSDKEKKHIRKRDVYFYTKLHGEIPSGYTLHHLFYDNLEYNEDSFVIITNEEHSEIHNGAVGKKTDGWNYYEQQCEYRSRPEVKSHKREYDKEYMSKLENKERRKEYRKDYYSKEENKEHRREYIRAYRARKKAEKLAAESC